MTDRANSHSRVVSILVVSTCTVLAGIWVMPLVLAQDEKLAHPVNQLAGSPGEYAEPPMELVLHVDGQTHDAQLDRPVQIRVGDRDLSVKVTAKPCRTFRAAGIEFQYPRHFGFEADRSEPAMTTWSLDGNDAVITVMKPTARMQPDELRDSMLDAVRVQFGSEKTRTAGSSIRLGGQSVSGKRLITQVGTLELHQDFFAFRRGESAVLLLIQGTPENGQSTDENRRVRRLLETSFRLIP